MEVIGYIIGALNLALGIIIAIIRNNYGNIILAKDQIKEQFYLTYMELSNNLGSSSIDDDSLKYSAVRLKKLHFSSVTDIHLINIIDFFINKLIFILLIFIVLVIISLVTGKIFLSNDNHLQLIFFIIIPVTFFIIEISILMLLLLIEKYLLNTCNKYRNLEY